MIERDDVQDVQVLALVLVDALDLHVEQRVRIDRRCRCAARDQLGEVALVGALDLAPLRAERRVVRERLELAAARSRSLIQPSPIASRDQTRQPRIAQHHPAARRHAVRLVAEPLRPQLVEVLQHVLLQQLRVQLRHAVDRVAADAREVRHAHVALAVLVDQRQAREPLLVAEKRMRTSSRKRALISKMISRCRGRTRPNSASGQHSSASGSSV